MVWILLLLVCSWPGLVSCFISMVGCFYLSSYSMVAWILVFCGICFGEFLDCFCLILLGPVDSTWNGLLGLSGR